MSDHGSKKSGLMHSCTLSSNSGRPRGGTAEIRAKRLRQVALEVFSEFGYERATLKEIARRAGASKETLYSQYSSKEAMFVAVVRDYLAGPFLSFDSLLTGKNRSIKQDLESFVFKLLTVMMRDQKHLVAHLVFSGSNHFPEMGRLFWENAHVSGQHQLGLYLKKQMENGRLARGDHHLMARQLLELATGDVILKSLLNVQRFMSATERRSRASSTVSLFLKGYGV